ncbi:DMT family transporter [Planosporangium thailandense]|uniref:DMT family transporter n=1 Tax=Planosporangium thailandense TaxID=765197 RepID=A0ABX0XZ57_9ACTN|nr:DMT family transporter [Planosporangium thailandense]NJC71182.1 DMT family transporter [Planosporangium thailandense]
MVYAMAVCAAALIGIGTAIQQRAAARAPSGTELHWRLLGYLVHQRLWLSGIGVAVCGNVLAGIALGFGGVALVEPLTVTGLLFALPVAAAWSRYRIGRREWSGALAVVFGLIAFLLAGEPSPGRRPDAPAWQWALAAAAIGTITASLVHLARRLRPQHEAAVLGLGAGMLFGLQAALTSTAMRRLFNHGLLALLVSWTPYALVAVAVVGMLLAQSAYKLAPLPVSYPPVAAAEPIAGIAIGIGVLEGSLRIAPLALAVEILALAVMTAGVYILAATRLVEAHHRPHHVPRPHLRSHLPPAGR